MELPAITPEITLHSTWYSTWLRELVNGDFSIKFHHLNYSALHKKMRWLNSSENSGDYGFLFCKNVSFRNHYFFGVENFKNLVEILHLFILDRFKIGKLPPRSIAKFRSVNSHFMRCGACCFLRGICVLRECSIIRAASSSFRPSSWSSKSASSSVSTVQIFFKYLPREITTWDSLPPFSSHTCDHPIDTCPDDHYLIVIADNPLVGAIVAIVIILLAAPVHSVWWFTGGTNREATRQRTCQISACDWEREVPEISLTLAYSSALVSPFRSDRCWWFS